MNVVDQSIEISTSQTMPQITPSELDPEIAARCLPALEKQGFEEDAVFRAMKVLETRLCSMAGSPPDVTGAALARMVLGKKSAFWSGKSESERDGIQSIISGLFTLNRNASAHRFISYKHADATIIVQFVSLVLKWLHQGIEAQVFDFLDPGENAFSVLHRDINGDGHPEKIVIVRQREEEFGSNWGAYILDKNAATPDTAIKLLHEEPAQLMEAEIRDINADGIPEVLIRWRAGAHGEWLRIWRWDGLAYTDITSGGFFSDAASIRVSDVDSDGKEEITVKSRDLDNPITRSIIRTYHWIGGQYDLMAERTEMENSASTGTLEEQVIQLVFRYEPAARKFVEKCRQTKGMRSGWLIDPEPALGATWHRAQLFGNDASAPTLGTFNHYTVNTATGEVRSMFFHNTDDSVSLHSSWP